VARRSGGLAAQLLEAATAQGWVVQHSAPARRGALLRTTKHRLVHAGAQQLLILEHRSSGDLYRRQTYVRRGGLEMYWLDNATSVRTVLETRTVPQDALPVQAR
jgi:tRNA isopentenyl-2-thiomethyl-A-37 hydroxylase MiaE